MKKTSQKHSQVAKIISSLLQESNLQGLAHLVAARPKLITDLDWSALENYVEKANQKDVIKVYEILKKTPAASNQEMLGVFLERAVRDGDLDFYRAFSFEKGYCFVNLLVNLSIAYDTSIFLEIEKNLTKKDNKPSTSSDKKINDVVFFLQKKWDVLELLAQYKSFSILSFLKDHQLFDREIFFKDLTEEKMNFLKNSAAISWFFEKLATRKYQGYDDNEKIKDIVLFHLINHEQNCFNDLVLFIERCYKTSPNLETVKMLDAVYSLAPFYILDLVKNTLPSDIKIKTKNYPGHIEFFEKNLILKSVEKIPSVQEKRQKRIL